MAIKEETIDGIRLTHSTMPVSKVYQLAPRLAPLFLGLLGAKSIIAAAVRGRELDLGSMDMDELQGVLTSFAAALAKPENKNLPIELLEQTTALVTVNGVSSVTALRNTQEIDMTFEGKPMALFRAMYGSLMFNFADFTRGVGAIARTKASPTPTPNP